MGGLGGQLDGNFLPGSLPHKFILFVALIICFVVNNFFTFSDSTDSPTVYRYFRAYPFFLFSFPVFHFLVVGTARWIKLTHVSF